MILDELKNPNLTIQSQEWNLVTDQVMGGVSVGKLSVEEIEGFKCYRMIGEVSTKNNGGFIQIRTKLNPEIYSKDYKGVYIKVYGNNNNYNLHLFTIVFAEPTIDVKGLNLIKKDKLSVGIRLPSLKNFYNHKIANLEPVSLNHQIHLSNQQIPNRYNFLKIYS